MADEKMNTGPGEKKIPEAPEPVTAGQPQAPAPEQTAPAPQQEQAGPAKPDPGDVVVSFEQINELMGEKRKAARAEVFRACCPYQLRTPKKEQVKAAGRYSRRKRKRACQNHAIQAGPLSRLERRGNYPQRLPPHERGL